MYLGNYNIRKENFPTVEITACEKKKVSRKSQIENNSSRKKNPTN